MKLLYAIHMKIELTRMDVKDLDVQVTENAISISGDRSAENKR